MLAHDVPKLLAQVRIKPASSLFDPVDRFLLRLISAQLEVRFFIMEFHASVQISLMFIMEFHGCLGGLLSWWRVPVARLCSLIFPSYWRRFASSLLHRFVFAFGVPPFDFGAT